MARKAGRQRLPEGAADHLRASDPVLASIIDRVGPFEPSHEPDLWWALVDAIVSQQISVRAAAAILERVSALGDGVGRPTPADLARASEEELRARGLSRAKVRYLQNLAARWLDGSLDPEALPSLPDEEVVRRLVQVKGIGRWTAEMVLIFCLRRPDVLPVDDLGLRTAVQRAYGLAARPDRAALVALGEPWRPFRSAATLYLWQSLLLPAPVVPPLGTARALFRAVGGK